MSIITKESIIDILNSKKTIPLLPLLLEYSKDKNIEEEYVNKLLHSPLVHHININKLLLHFRIKYQIGELIDNNKVIKYY